MNKTILAIGAHPDDIEIGCGGTLALLKKQGYVLNFVIVTSGEEGSLDIPQEHLKKIRENEAIHSARLLGAKDIIFFRENDGLTQVRKKTKIRLISIIRVLKPAIVFTHAGSDRFSDHKIVHDVSLAAIQAAQGPWYPNALGKPHSPSHIFGYEVWNPINEPQLLNDITQTIDKKISALKKHASQTANVNYLAAVQGLAAYRGALSMKGPFAEAFEVIKSGGIL